MSKPEHREYPMDRAFKNLAALLQAAMQENKAADGHGTVRWQDADLAFVWFPRDLAKLGTVEIAGKQYALDPKSANVAAMGVDGLLGPQFVEVAKRLQQVLAERAAAERKAQHRKDIRKGVIARWGDENLGRMAWDWADPKVDPVRTAELSRPRLIQAARKLYERYSDLPERQEDLPDHSGIPMLTAREWAYVRDFVRHCCAVRERTMAEEFARREKRARREAAKAAAQEPQKPAERPAEKIGEAVSVVRIPAPPPFMPAPNSMI